MAAATKPRAFSYTRVSSGQQVEGGGLDRQADMATAWCQRNGYELDTKLDLSDKGRSAYKGKHLSHGALGRFLELAKAGQLGEQPVLLVEAVDRLSRQEPLDALEEIFLGLCKRAGVVIVDLEDGQEYSRETLNRDAMALVKLSLKCQAAHDYSKRLARRVSSSWDQLRQDLRSGSAVGRGPAGGKHPYWLTLNTDTRQWELNQHADDVRLIFNDLQHQGLSLVARTLNAKGSRSPGGKLWAHHSVRKVATDPAAAGHLRLGIYAHTEGRAAHSRWEKAKAKAAAAGVRFTEPEPVVPPIELIPDHYPAVVSQEVFDRVAAALDRRGKEKRAGGNRASTAVHTFLQSGMARCQHGGSMGATLSRKPGRQDIYSFRCRARSGGKGCRCNGKGWRREDVHAHVVTRLSLHLLGEAALPGHDHTAELDGLEGQLRAAKQLLSTAAEQLEKASTTLARAVDQDAQLDLLENLSHLVEKRRAAHRSAEAQVAQLATDIASLKARSHPADELRSNPVRQLLQALANGTDTLAERERLHHVLVRADLRVVLDDSDPDRRKVGMRFGDTAELDWQPLAPQARTQALKLGMVQPWEATDHDWGYEITKHENLFGDVVSIYDSNELLGDYKITDWKKYEEWFEKNKDAIQARFAPHPDDIDPATGEYRPADS